MKEISKQLSESFGINLIANTQEFRQLYSAYKISRLAQELLIENSEIRDYSDINVIGKILQSDNAYLATMLSSSLKAIVTYLKERQYKFTIHVYLSKDPYVRNWEGITILIYANYRNFAEQMKIWREIETLVTSIFNSARNKDSIDIRKINEANEVIATSVEKLE
jgi:hypothetical protein